jgi:hypothetical protein
LIFNIPDEAPRPRHSNKRCIPPNIAERLLETIAREELNLRELEVPKPVDPGEYSNPLPLSSTLSSTLPSGSISAIFGMVGSPWPAR